MQKIARSKGPDIDRFVIPNNAYSGECDIMSYWFLTIYKPALMEILCPQILHAERF